jgi:hypothetical protein
MPLQKRYTNSPQLAMRWRNVGLQAIKSVASSEALASVAGKQLKVIIPILLENVWTDNGAFLDTLEHRAKLQEKEETEKILRRRNSVATVRTVDTANDGNALAESTADADKLAEEDIGVLAIQCLQQIFVVNNRHVWITPPSKTYANANTNIRSQIYGGTVATLAFISDRVAQNEQVCSNFFYSTSHMSGSIRKLSCTLCKL